MGYSVAGCDGHPPRVIPYPHLLPETFPLDVTTLPLPPEARAVLRTIADDIRKPPAGATADPIALRRWLDRIGKRLDGLAAIRAGGTPAPTAVARNAANPRAAMREEDRPPGIMVETRKRRPPR